ncbi:zinc-ribbon domain-containing protein [Rhodoferax sp.]|uniref:zinc-ribbon domain-containing protein n=1 Tax=Rhodoferax sp. TaxID=50421 RepID=UPI002775C79F|nr:zinc-ribbon domain-containing protein [Rhodoferax sp.]
MTMKCPACGKENVEAAKFCKKCGAYLAWQSTTMEPGSDFAATQMASDFAEPDSDATVIRPAARPAARQSRAPVAAAPDPLLEALADRSSPSAGPPKVAAAPAQDVPVRSAKAGLIVGALVLVAVLAAALAYWLLGRESAPASVRPAAVAPAASPEPVAAPIAEPLSVAPSIAPVQPTPEPTAVVPPAAQAPVAAPAEPVKPRPKPAPAKPAPVQAIPRPVAPPAAPVAPPPPAPAAAEPAPVVPTGPSSPTQACEGKSFFGKPACMNEQCATPRFTKHPQCVELREQNRRREEQQLRN